MPILVYFENAADKNGERDEYDMIVGCGSSYAELSAFFETDAEYMAAFPALVKQAKANNFDMITESDVCEDEEPERVAEARARFRPKDSYTPGPWHWVETEGYGYEINDREDNTIIATGLTKANARLITAAPDLLEALESLEYEASQEDINTPLNIAILQARKAIAKAKEPQNERV